MISFSQIIFYYWRYKNWSDFYLLFFNSYFSEIYKNINVFLLCIFIYIIHYCQPYININSFLPFYINTFIIKNTKRWIFLFHIYLFIINYMIVFPYRILLANMHMKIVNNFHLSFSYTILLSNSKIIMFFFHFYYCFVIKHIKILYYFYFSFLNMISLRYFIWL